MHSQQFLRDRILRARRGGSRRARYPADLRLEVAAHVRARRARGETMTAIAAEFDLTRRTLYGWLSAAPRSRGSLRRVQVVEDARPSGYATLTTPQGYRIEADLDVLATLLRKLS